MKRFILFLSLLSFTMTPTFAAGDVPTFKFDGNKYSLFFSAKTNETRSYINEYYKKNETYLKWSELIALHHFPDAFYPVEKSREFAQYLKENGVAVFGLDKDDDANSAILDFVVVSEKTRPIIVEYNIFRYEKDKICGTIAFQYAKRYAVENRFDVKKLVSKLENERKKSLKNFEKLSMPELILADIDKGKYVTRELQESVEPCDIEGSEEDLCEDYIESLDENTAE